MFRFNLIAVLSFCSLIACGDKDGVILPHGDTVEGPIGPHGETLPGPHGGTMIRITAGIFDMGCTEVQSDQCLDNERPPLTVTLPIPDLRVDRQVRARPFGDPRCNTRVLVRCLPVYHIQHFRNI